MNSIIENLTGLNTLSDQIIAMDLLMASKSGIKMYAVAATESATPELKTVFQTHLLEAVDTHEKITAYMMQRGFYHPYNIEEQIRLDQSNAQTALNIPS
jgi:similar to spore coat protein